MSLPGKALMRRARYALPEALGRRLPVQSSDAAASACASLARTEGLRISLGYFALPDEAPEAVAEAFIDAARALKGMGNFESLSDTPVPIFFLLVVKCTAVLAHLEEHFPAAGLRIGSPVLLRGDALRGGAAAA